MRWFTGTPCNFDGTIDFFDRESGLTSRGFSALGIDSGSITLGPAKEGDLPMMRRASMGELESAEWWASLGLDGFIFYSWGRAKYRGIVEAAMRAGIKVAQVTDNQGISSPISDFPAHFRAEGSHFWNEPRWKQLARTAVKLPYTLTLRVLTRDVPDAEAMAASDLFFAATPGAAERYRGMVRRLADGNAAERIRFIPIPVNFHFKFGEDDAKFDEVIAVGRWDSIQKRTPLLMSSIELALNRTPRFRFRIFGRVTDELSAWHSTLAASVRPRVVLEGMVSNAELAEANRRAKIMLVSAAFEGCHNASAEAVCSGASVVGCRSPFLGAIEWHASRNSGTLAHKADAESMNKALFREIEAWDSGRRDPKAISDAWTVEMHPERVAQRILREFGIDAPAPAR